VNKGSEAERNGAHEEKATKDLAGTELIAEGPGNEADKQTAEGY
jgi:hypothetical protein